MAMQGTDTDDDLEYHPPTREEVFAQLEDWRRRLHALYADIISWLPAGEGYETEIRDYLTDEGPMRHAGVPPQPVPELRVFHHSQLRLTFTPDACWIIGAAGRVRVRDRLYIHRLVDSDSPFVPKGWRLARSDWLHLDISQPLYSQPLDPSKLRGAPFSKEQLAGLLEPTDA